MGSMLNKSTFLLAFNSLNWFKAVYEEKCFGDRKKAKNIEDG